MCDCSCEKDYNWNYCCEDDSGPYEFDGCECKCGCIDDKCKCLQVERDSNAKSSNDVIL